MGKLELVFWHASFVGDCLQLFWGRVYKFEPEVLEALSAIRALCPSCVPLTIETHDLALRLTDQYGYHICDSLVIAAALQASCGTLYSEDMRDGQVIEGLTIRNPFTGL